MLSVSLRADCAHCAALCCVALAFDRSESFAFDKPAGCPCRNLTQDNRCRIHAERAVRGFSGCVSYDCHGAGQRVTQDMFQGRTWREEPALLRPMLRAFILMQEIHRLLMLLREAAKAPLPVEDRRRLSQLEQALQPPQGWTAHSLNLYDRERMKKRVGEFLVSVRPHFENRIKPPTSSAQQSPPR